MSAHQLDDSKTYRDLLSALKPPPQTSWQSLQQASLARFQALGFPTRHHEGWKYVPVERILNTACAEKLSGVVSDKGQALLKPYFLEKTNFERIAFVDGMLDQSSSVIKHLPAGVRLISLAAALEEQKDLQERLAARLTEEPNALAAANGFQFQDGVYLFVPKHQKLTLPIHLLIAQLGHHGNALSQHLRFAVELADDAQAEIVCDHLGMTEQSYLSNTVFEFTVGRHARLKCFNIERHGRAAIHLNAMRFFLKEDARLDLLSYSHGGITTRNDLHVTFEGPNASCYLKGLAVMNDDSQTFQHVHVKHQVPNCTSRQVFKNIAAGRGVTEVNSLVHMVRDAQKSDSHQLIRNLLLSPAAHAYARPQLKIYADDVKAAHGAATGQLGREELFYLKSRGLSEKMARFVLTYGFAEEIVEDIPFPTIRSQIETDMKNEIEKLVT